MATNVDRRSLRVSLSWWRVCWASVALLDLASAWAAPGNLDTTFGSNGLVITPLLGGDDTAVSAVVQPDNTIVVAGSTWNGTDSDYVFVRYGANGDLDPGFGSGGKVVLDIATEDDQANALVVQPDGKLVAAGFSGTAGVADVSLARFGSDGVLDPSFGSGGRVATILGPGHDDAYALARQADGKLIAGGYTQSLAGDLDGLLVRYNTDGSLDGGFGAGGIVVLRVGPRDEVIYSVMVLPDQTILAAGTAWNGTDYDFLLARFLDDGTPDATFGGGSVLTSVLAGDDYAFSALVQPDTKIVLAGYAWNGTDNDVALVRFLADGTPDAGFGTAGRVTSPVLGGDDKAYAVVRESSGKLVVAGPVADGGSHKFGLVRFAANGALDWSFGIGGKVTTLVGAIGSRARGMVLQPDGKLLVLGNAENGIDRDIALARYLGGSCGNGTVESGETCDDGNIADGDCCSSACQFEPSGSACGYDGNACTDDRCDEEGTCTHSSKAGTCDTCTLLVVDSAALGGSGAVFRVDGATGAQTVVSSGGNFVNPCGVAVEATGQILVVDSDSVTNSGSVVRVDPSNGTQTVLSEGGAFVNPCGIAVGPSGEIYVAEIASAIVRVDPATGAQVTIASGGSLVTPRGVAIEASGQLIVADFETSGGTGRIIRVDPITGTQAIVSSGGSLIDPYGVTVAPNGDLLIADNSAMAVIRVDATTGVQQVVASSADPRHIALTGSGDLLVTGHGVLRLNPTTDEQSLVSTDGMFVSPQATALESSPSACDLISTCGDSNVNAGEQCDDGNTVSGDCCSASCATESCDDAIGCTVDSCVAPTGCVNTPDDGACSDGIDCTVNQCSPSLGCTSTPDHDSCDDDNLCTDDSCTPGVGCSSATNSAPCNDGLFCNGPDTCAAGTCAAHDGDPCDGTGVCSGGPCNEATNTCAVTAGTPCPADGNACTDDVCDGQGACGTANTAACNDGVFCNGTDVCADGVCVHAGDPCPGDECRTCQEAAASCEDPAGTTCTSDIDICTLDQCNGAGVCAHPPVFLAAACQWLLVAGNTPDRPQVEVRPGFNTEIEGNVCADRASIGENVLVSGGGVLVATRVDAAAMIVQPHAAMDTGDVLTGGGCVNGALGALLFDTASSSVCAADSPVPLPGGGVIDASGTDSRVNDCELAQVQMLGDSALLESLPSTASLGRVTCRTTGTPACTISARQSGLNILDVDVLTVANLATLELDAAGFVDPIFVVRVARTIKFGRQTTLALGAGVDAERVLLYGGSRKCDFGDQSTGSGVVFCPHGRLRLGASAVWDGALLGGLKRLEIGLNGVITHRPFLLQ